MFTDIQGIWSLVGKFLFLSALHNEQPGLSSSVSSTSFSGLWNPSSFTDLLPTCAHIGKVAETSGGWIIYLYIHYKYFFDLVKSSELEKPFLSLMSPLILRRSHSGFKGHLKFSLLLFDSPFNISLQFCFTKSSLLTVFVATAIFLGLQRNLRY